MAASEEASFELYDEFAAADTDFASISTSGRPSATAIQTAGMRYAETSRTCLGSEYAANGDMTQCVLRMQTQEASAVGATRAQPILLLILTFSKRRAQSLYAPTSRGVHQPLHRLREDDHNDQGDAPAAP